LLYKVSGYVIQAAPQPGGGLVVVAEFV